MATSKNYFTRQLELSHKEIKGKRALMFSEDAQRDSERYIREIQDAKRNLERKLLNLEDFHVSSTTSLEVTKDGFNSNVWVTEINDTMVRLEIVERKLSIAEDIHTKYFG